MLDRPELGWKSHSRRKPEVVARLKPDYKCNGYADSYRKLVCYLLLKCNYADNSHLVDHKAHYTSHETGTPLRRTIYTLWRDINKTEPANVLYGCRSRQIGLRLDRFLLVNDARNHRAVGTQLTGCTCYFQTYLFALLCKVGRLPLPLPQA